MTTTHAKPLNGKREIYDAIIDQLRACKTASEILQFENWFNSNSSCGPLYTVICDLLRDRSISRATASRWFEALLNDRDEKLGIKNR